MDFVHEQLYARKKRFTDYLLQLLIAFVCLGLSALVTGYLVGVFGNFFFPAIISFAICFGGYKLYMLFNVEFEYSVVNGEMDVDKIISRTVRTRLFTVKSKTFDTFEVYDGNAKAKLSGMHFNKVFNLLSNTGAPAHYAIFNHPTHKKTLLIFEPDDLLVEEFKRNMNKGNASGFIRRQNDVV